jgi:hypothetical protein
MTRSSSGALFAVLFLLTAALSAAGLETSTDRARASCRNEMVTIDADRAARIEKNTEKFEKLGFGTGYGAVWNLDDRVRVEEAEVVSNVVRVSRDHDVQFGPILELHKFVWALKSQAVARLADLHFLGRTVPDTCRSLAVVRKVPIVGLGPFVGLRVGGDDVVETFAVGAMFLFRTPESDKSLNLAVAYAIDPSVRTLGDGIEEGKPLPEGETQIRYRTTHQEGLVVLFSVGW